MRTEAEIEVLYQKISRLVPAQPFGHDRGEAVIVSSVLEYVLGLGDPAWAEEYVDLLKTRADANVPSLKGASDGEACEGDPTEDRQDTWEETT